MPRTKTNCKILGRTFKLLQALKTNVVDGLGLSMRFSASNRLKIESGSGRAKKHVEDWINFLSVVVEKRSRCGEVVVDGFRPTTKG